MHSYILHIELEKSTKEKGDILQDELKLLSEDSLQLMKQLINNIHETGE